MLLMQTMTTADGELAGIGSARLKSRCDAASQISAARATVGRSIFRRAYSTPGDASGRLRSHSMHSGEEEDVPSERPLIFFCWRVWYGAASHSAADVRTFVQSGRFFARSKAPISAVISDARGGWEGPGSTSARVRRFSL